MSSGGSGGQRGGSRGFLRGVRCAPSPVLTPRSRQVEPRRLIASSPRIHRSGCRAGERLWQRLEPLRAPLADHAISYTCGTFVMATPCPRPRAERLPQRMWGPKSPINHQSSGPWVVRHQTARPSAARTRVPHLPSGRTHLGRSLRPSLPVLAAPSLSAWPSPWLGLPCCHQATFPGLRSSEAIPPACFFNALRVPLRPQWSPPSLCCDEDMSSLGLIRPLLAARPQPLENMTEVRSSPAAQSPALGATVNAGLSREPTPGVPLGRLVWFGSVLF